MSHKLYIASDHGGTDLKSFIISSLKDIQFNDLGTNSNDSVHYPHFADKLCHAILNNPSPSQGILICGTGIGISMRANRFPGIRAALVYDTNTAKMTKAHNNANIICLGGRTISNEHAIEIINIWLNTKFEGGRHQTRVDLIDAPLFK